MCHRLVTNIHANNKHTIHRGVQIIEYIKYAVHIVMKAVVLSYTYSTCAKYNTYTFIDPDTQVHTHWGQCGAMAPVLRDMVLICGVCIFRIDCAMPRKAFNSQHRAVECGMCSCTHTLRCSLTTKHMCIHTYAATAA